jgi:hypothetical protein
VSLIQTLAIAEHLNFPPCRQWVRRQPVERKRAREDTGGRSGLWSDPWSTFMREFISAIQPYARTTVVAWHNGSFGSIVSTTRTSRTRTPMRLSRCGRAPMMLRRQRASRCFTPCFPLCSAGLAGGEPRRYRVRRSDGAAGLSARQVAPPRRASN